MLLERSKKFVNQNMKLFFLTIEINFQNKNSNSCCRQFWKSDWHLFICMCGHLCIHKVSPECWLWRIALQITVIIKLGFQLSKGENDFFFIVGSLSLAPTWKMWVLSLVEVVCRVKTNGRGPVSNGNMNSTTEDTLRWD